MVDAQKNVYLTGSTESADFPTQNASQPLFGGQEDAFLLKLDPSGSSLNYSTFIGGTDRDTGYSVIVDLSGQAYVTGRTRSSDFPTLNPLQSAFGGGASDAFVAKFNGSGARHYATYLGGGTGDEGRDIALDSEGNLYLTGNTWSFDFPTVNPLQATFGGGVGSDVFVCKLDPAGSALLYSTYLGGGDHDSSSALTVDAAGNAYITGEVWSQNFPTLNPLQSNIVAGSDAFVAKLNASGSQLVYSTYLGGSSSEMGSGISVDETGKVLVVGNTYSTDFPLASAIQSTRGAVGDAFIAELNAQGSALLSSSYLGGDGDDIAWDVALDTSGRAYLTGTTGSLNFPVRNALQASPGGLDTAFITRIAPEERLHFAQFAFGSQDGTDIFSQITLLNLRSSTPANVSIEITDDEGTPLTVDLNDVTVEGETEVIVPAQGLVTLKTGNQGPLRTGSVVISSDVELAGGVVFEGSIGVAGVNNSAALRNYGGSCGNGSRRKHRSRDRVPGNRADDPIRTAG